MKTQCERNKSALLYLPLHQHALDAAVGNGPQAGGASGPQEAGEICPVTPEQEQALRFSTD
jgi:hypothetical protein